MSLVCLCAKLQCIFGYFVMFFRRPGILVLINDADWELMVLQSNVWGGGGGE